MLNSLLDEKADDLIGAERHERTTEREACRAGHYDRKLATTSGEVTIRMPKLKGMRLTTAIIERYRRRETSVEEAMMEMYLAGVSVRHIEDVVVMVAIDVNDDGYREVIGAAEGFTESAEWWREFLSWLRPRGLGARECSPETRPPGWWAR